MVLIFWMLQCLRGKIAVGRIQEIGLEICALAAACAADSEVVRQGKELFEEIKMQEMFLNEQAGKMGRSVLIYMSLFLAWLVFTAGDISPDISRYDAALIGNIFVALAAVLALK